MAGHHPPDRVVRHTGHGYHPHRDATKLLGYLQEVASESGDDGKAVGIRHDREATWAVRERTQQFVCLVVGKRVSRAHRPGSKPAY